MGSVTVPQKDLVQPNGVSDSGKQISKSRMEDANNESRAAQYLSKEHDHVLKSFRTMIAQLCQQYGGGHPGGAIGMAAIGIALWKYVMRYAPHSPDWFNRDRFVLSNGHTCLFQYSFLHLTGYKDMTWEMLNSYHSDRPDMLCPGHPEIEIEGIEVTTGPLGQGIANAVGMAMASKHLAAQFNRPGHEIISNHIWCMVGDACLQEGVALEAISFAGHLKLDNLTVMYDNNQITCDGSVDICCNDDVNAKMRACGWEVFNIYDGCYAIDEIIDVLHRAKSSKGKPTFINIRTIIGLGSSIAGDALSHGAALGAENVANMKKAAGFDPEAELIYSDEVHKFFEECVPRGERWAQEWNQEFEAYKNAEPKLAAEFEERLKGGLPADWESQIPTSFSPDKSATRKSSGAVLNPLAEKYKHFLVGTADLTPSVNMAWKGKEDFQHPDLRTECGINGSYNGRYIHYGIREHAMCAIANGMAAYSPNFIIPVTSSFFMFYIYAAPAVRMGALQHLQVIHVATHDSIGMGEDGPTHQPLEVASLYRAMPNILYIRPGDTEEVAGAYIAAINAKHTPSIISTSRHGVPQLTGKTSRKGVQKGAYVLEEEKNADLTVIGCGAELSHAVEAAKLLREKNGLKVRVISFPSHRLFEKQSKEYQRETLRRHDGIPAVVVEPYVALGWERYSDAAVCMSTDRYGQSLPGNDAYKYFQFLGDQVASRIMVWWEERKTGKILPGEFAELVPKLD